MSAEGFRYGPDNPHPLSTRKTELVWEGKYDEYGNRRKVDIAGCAMPMQKIETIDAGHILSFKISELCVTKRYLKKIFMPLYH